MLRQWLDPAEYLVDSCEGHIRDLPQDSKAVDAVLSSSTSLGIQLRQQYSRCEGWTAQAKRMGFEVDHFSPVYLPIPAKLKVISRLKAALESHPIEEVVLATDADREGEAIAWHLVESLWPLPSVTMDPTISSDQPSAATKPPAKSKKATKKATPSSSLPAMLLSRAIFHEISKKAIFDALAQRKRGALAHYDQVLDMNLVQAQETRRLLDRLTGFTVSPIVWKHVAFGLSAGRVQSPALALLADKELSRLNFVPSSYFTFPARFSLVPRSPAFDFEAELITLDGVAFDPLLQDEPMALHDQDQDPPSTPRALPTMERHAADSLCAALTASPPHAWRLRSVTSHETTRQPPPPFTTASLQQAASSLLGMRSKSTMMTAQWLYEQGYITYMRTDKAALSDDARQVALSLLQAQDPLFSPPAARSGTVPASSLHAQEAHEAIRPTIDAATNSFRPPESLQSLLDKHQFALYRLIYLRTLASLMDPSVHLTVTVLIDGPRDSVWRAHFRKTLRLGYLRCHPAERQPDSPLADAVQQLPPAAPLTLQQVTAVAHITAPPKRLSESGLVRALEKHGIGRPSTYASIIDTLTTRKYAVSSGAATLIPTLTGLTVHQLLARHLAPLVDFNFTSQVEAALDQIAHGRLVGADYLRRFYAEMLKPQLDALHAIKVGKKLVPLAIIPQATQRHLQVRGYELLIGPHSLFLQARADATHRVGIPFDLPPDQLSPDFIDTILTLSAAPQLGMDPLTQQPIIHGIGAYGAFLKVGDTTISTPITLLSLEAALQLISNARKDHQPFPLNDNPSIGAESIITKKGKSQPKLLVKKKSSRISKNNNNNKNKKEI